MISKSCKKFAASCVTFRIRWSHVSWEIAQDVVESHFVVDHLVLEHRRAQRCEILMGPSVRCDLMSFSNHPLDHSCPLCSSINWALSKVVSSDHESRLCSINSKLVQKIGSVIIRSIIKSERNISWVYTIVNSSSSICNRTKLCSSDRSGGGSRRLDVGIAKGTVIELTVRCRTIVFSCTTPSSRRTAIGTISNTRTALSIQTRGECCTFFHRTWISLLVLNHSRSNNRQGTSSPHFREESSSTHQPGHCGMDISRIGVGVGHGSKSSNNHG